MIGLVACAALVAILVVIAFALVDAGIRAGDQSGDVLVSAVMGEVEQPDGVLPVVVVTVRNPGDVPALVGLSVRRAWLPAWLRSGVSVSVPRRTLRRRSRPDQQAVLGVIDAGETAQWSVPSAPGAWHCRLLAIVGQAGRRLRVIDVPLPPYRRNEPGPHRTLLERRCRP